MDSDEIKSISYPLDLLPVKSHHVKAAVCTLAVSAAHEIKQRSSADHVLFPSVHCSRCTAACFIVSVFYLNKHQLPSVPGDQIDLSGTAAEVVFKDFKSP